jgi:signal transduction histidine kinase
MRLLTKTTLYFLIALVPLLVAAGFYLYQGFSKELKQRMDQELITEEIQWIRYLRTQAASGTTFILKTPEILIAPVDGVPSRYPAINTVTAPGANNNRQIPFRQLKHIVQIDGTTYLISLHRSLEQRTALAATATRIMLLVFITIFIITIVVNWFISQSIWRPFRRSLQKISSAELQKMEAIHFEKTGIKEFDELNASLNEMADKIHRDYINMKEFTENAAHEMQTPVAIAQGKLELLLQDTNLREEQIDYAMQATEALSRLNKLNQSLLLLAKIENNQYETSESISLVEVTKKYLQLFDAHISDKQLVIDTQFREDWKLNLHVLLADSLVSNLLGNAIKYNYSGGKIMIVVHQDYYSISNTSFEPPIDPTQIFKRFNRFTKTSQNSTGLGLAIVKKICDTQNLQITYESKNTVHQFIIRNK